MLGQPVVFVICARNQSIYLQNTSDPIPSQDLYRKEPFCSLMGRREPLLLVSEIIFSICSAIQEGLRKPSGDPKVEINATLCSGALAVCRSMPSSLAKEALWVLFWNHRRTGRFTDKADVYLVPQAHVQTFS